MQHRNLLLSLMDPADLAELSPLLIEIPLYAGQTLYERGNPVDLVYFPSSCSIAMISVMPDGHEVETASVGFEGAVGILPAINGNGAPSRIKVRIGGVALAVPAVRLREHAQRSAALMRIILLFFQAAAAQAQQLAACYAVHQLRARLARCLLTCEDRVGHPTIMLTQDDMGMMTGALRGSVSLTAGHFKNEGLIRYSRGHVQILDRAGLERLACDCYGASRQHGAQFSRIAADPDERQASRA
jgi:CRP-like cAMP-binding protein